MADKIEEAADKVTEAAYKTKGKVIEWISDGNPHKILHSFPPNSEIKLPAPGLRPGVLIF